MKIVMCAYRRLAYPNPLYWVGGHGSGDEESSFNNCWTEDDDTEGICDGGIDGAYRGGNDAQGKSGKGQISQPKMETKDTHAMKEVIRKLN